jgi:hypothetical protein
VLGTYKSSVLDTHFDRQSLRPLRPVMRLIIILLALVVQVLSNTINANTTSGQLLGTEADGGMCYLLLLAFPSPN